MLGLAVAGALGAAAAGLGAAEPDELGKIRANGLRICADPANLPFSSDDPATPGFEVELARLIAAELGAEPRLQWHGTYSRALRPLRENSCDLFMGLPTDERFREGNPWIAVSRAYYRMGHALVTPSDSPITSLEHMRGGVRVAVEATGVADFYLGYKDVRRGLYRKPGDIVGAVAKGEASAALLWLPVASWEARAHLGLRVLPVRHAELEFPIGAGVRRREGDLARGVDAAVARLTENGRAREILLRYGAVPPSQSGRRPSPFVLAQAPDPVEAGRSLFSTACSRCHGAEGAGGGLGGTVPVIRSYDGGQEKFVRVVRDGKRNTPMAPFKGILTNEEIVTIYQYLTSRPRQ